MKNIYILFLLFICSQSILSQSIIPINPSMVTNESGLGTAGNIADEQTASGDPLNSSGGNPTTEWHAGWNANDYPASIYVDLGQNAALTNISIYDNNGIDSLVVSYGSPGSWTQLFVDELPNYQIWNNHTVSVTTRYIRFTAIGSDAHFNEVVLYGTIGTSNDSIAPSVITDLSASGATSQSINLSWTSPGDDTTNGTATTYDIRYSTSPITNNTDFNNATQAVGEPTPQVAGSSENFTVSGLSSQTRYYFAIKTEDEVPNTSQLSNTASDSTVASSGTLPPLTKTYIHRPSLDPQWTTTPVYNALEPADFDVHWAALLASLPAGNASWNGGNINLGSNGTGYGLVQWNSASPSNKKPILIQLPSAGAAPGIGICPMNTNFIVASAMNNSTGTVNNAADYEVALLAIQQMIKNIQASGNATNDVFVIGKSQGGGTGLMTASLNDDVKDFFLSVPALSGYTGTMGTTGAFPGYASNNTNAYVDACNHAKRYRNKASFSISYDDAVTWARGQVTDSKNTQFTTIIYHGNDGHNDPTWWADGTAWLDSCLIGVVNNGVGLAGNTTNLNYLTQVSLLKVYPNPNNGSFTIQSPSKTGIYSLVNELGQTIKTFNLNAASNYSHTIEELESGVYFIVGYNEDKITRQKIVVTN